PKAMIIGYSEIYFVSPFVQTNTTPLNKDNVPNVTTKKFNPTLPINKPLIRKPNVAIINTVNKILAISGTPLDSSVTNMTPLNAITDPTDKSNPAVNNTIVIAIAMIHIPELAV